MHLLNPHPSCLCGHTINFKKSEGFYTIPAPDPAEKRYFCQSRLRILHILLLVFNYFEESLLKICYISLLQ